MSLPADASALFDLIIASYRHWTGEAFPVPERFGDDAASWVYRDAPFALLAHGAAADPLFVYANLAGQRLFGYTWAEMIGLPSRYSAPEELRPMREQLLRRVEQQGCVGDYRGIRVSKAGARFWIEQTTVWQLVDAGRSAGLAALIRGSRPA